MLGAPTVSIVIVNWNAGSYLRNCIDSIQKFGQGFVAQVVVIDNGSTDNSLEAIRGDSDVRIVETGANLGFAKACNIGASYCRSRYLLFLNPDAALHEHTLKSALDFMEDSKHSNVGICGVRLVDERGCTTTSAARFPTLKLMFSTSLGLGKIFPKIFPPHLLTVAELLSSRPVDQVIGAFFLMRSNVFELCDGFDEHFFVYYEEVDLSLRAKQLGWISYLLANATAFHKGGGSSESVKALRLFYTLRSRNTYAYKHFSSLDFFLLQILTILELPLRLLRGAIVGSVENMKNTMHAYTKLIMHYWKSRP